MALTEEQRERIRKNRENALKKRQEHELRRQRQELEEREAKKNVEENECKKILGNAEKLLEQQVVSVNGDEWVQIVDGSRKRANDESPGCFSSDSSTTKRKKEGIVGDGSVGGGGAASAVDEDATIELEAFEENASEFVSKQEAKIVYCLPEGTLAVCRYIEKPNPRNKLFAPMKLYYRAEIRRRARERYGGLLGLQAERRSRQEKQFENSLISVKDVFKIKK